MKKEADVAIVGGGPAGMISACLLAREGLKVIVLEKGEDFDREFRGEILQPRFMQAMKDVDLYSVVKSCPHEEIAGAQLCFYGLKVGQIPAKWIDHRNPKIWWMTQPDLLNGLNQFASQFQNYKILFGANVNRVGKRSLAASVNGAEVEISAKVIIASDGRFSTVKKLKKFETLYDHHDLDVVWFSIKRPANFTHYFSLFLTLRRAVLILPKYPNLLQCGMIFGPGKFVKERQKGIEFFKRKLRRAHPLFKDFANEIKDFSQFTLLKGNRALVSNWVEDGVVLIGDSAHTCSPAGGIGVSIAAETAIVASQVIIDAFKENDPSDQRLHKIQEIRASQVQAVHRAQGNAAVAISPLFAPLRILVPIVFPFLSLFRIAPIVMRGVLAQQSSFGTDFDEKLTVKEALDLYFSRSGFGQETYSDSWLRLPIGPFGFYLPNIQARKDVVPLHDVDHIIAEYSTDWKGELEITPFELGMGLGKYWMGWVIDLQGIWLSTFLYPISSIKAFARGRRTKSFYRHYGDDKDLMNRTVGEIRQAINLPSKDSVVPNAIDIIGYLGMLAASFLLHLPLFVGVAALVYFFVNSDLIRGLAGVP